MIADTLGAGRNGVIHQTHTQTWVQLGIELQRFCAKAFSGLDERILQVDEVLLIRALVDRDKQQVLSRQLQLGAAAGSAPQFAK